MNRFPMRVETAPVPEFGVERRILHRPVRVLFDGQVTHVYAWVDGTGVEVMSLAAPPTRAGWNVWRVDTPDGSFLISEDGGCGCSHPLKSWRPMVPVRVAHA